MKKYLLSKSMKFILLTLTAGMIIFYIVADYYHSEKDIFTEGDVVFVYSTLERDVEITATKEEEKLIRKWLTTLSSDNQELVPVWGYDKIMLKGEEGSVGFVIAGDEVYVYPEIGNKWRKGNAAQMYIAHSSDPELTQQINDLCRKVQENIH